MDPALWEAIRTEGQGRDQIEAIIRLDEPDVDLASVRVVARFGRIATCRLPIGAIFDVHADENVRSLKAARLVGPEPEPESTWPRNAESDSVKHSDVRRPDGLDLDGRGIVIGIADWFFDFSHPNFRNPDGTTRIEALWDQRSAIQGTSLEPYGYGTVLDRREIDRALRASNPYVEIGYDAGASDPGCMGSHGTHVTDIAAGSGTIGPAGLAPRATLVLVHLADRNTGGLANLGDSVRILEAVDFIAKTAGDRPWVINFSVGRHGGPHNGTTLAEMAVDELLESGPNRFVVQSAGNYFNKAIHSSGTLARGERRTLTLFVDQADLTPNELEIWTSSRTRLSIVIESPTGSRSRAVPVGESCRVRENGVVVGSIYNREGDPNSNRDNHVDFFLYPGAPSGLWKVHMEAKSRGDGVFHAWLERDDACRGCQAYFLNRDVDNTCTIGTLANGTLPLVVGAYDAHRQSRPVAPFSSSGPTRDNRLKPDIVAPGVQVLAARSRGLNCRDHYRPLVRKSGTSMAAPHVCGVVALCMQGIRRPIWSHEIRSLILGAAEAAGPSTDSGARVGKGYLDIPRVLRELRRLNAESSRPSSAVSEPAGHDEQHASPEVAMKDINSNIEPAELHAADYPIDIGTLDPDALFRTVTLRENVDSARISDDGYFLVARPGEAPTSPPRKGDLLVRIALGEPGLGHLARLTNDYLVPEHQVTAAEMSPESGLQGFYAAVRDLSAPAGTPALIARRVLDGAGHMLPYQLLLRPSPNPLVAKHLYDEQTSQNLQEAASTPFDSDESSSAIIDLDEIEVIEDDRAGREWLKAATESADFEFFPRSPQRSGSAKLEFLNLDTAVGSDARPHLYYVTTGAEPDAQAPARIDLKITNTNSTYNLMRGLLRLRLRSTQASGQQDRIVSLRGAEPGEWKDIPIPEIEDESHRDIPLRLETATLRRAHDPNSPRAALDVQFLWDEGLQSSGTREYYAQHALSFYIVDPVEILWRDARHVRDVEFSDPRKHRPYWTYIYEKVFENFDRSPVTVETEITASASYSAGGQLTITRGNTTANGTTVSANIGMERGASGSINLADIVEIGLENKTTASLGISRTYTTTREFARSVSRSESYSRSFSQTKRITRTIPRGTPGYVYTLWAYPKFALYEVPVVIFDGINDRGQATRRTRVDNIPLLRLIGWGELPTRKRAPGRRPPRRRPRPAPQHCPPGEATGATGICIADDSEAMPEFVHPSGIPAWQHLISFRPPHHVQTTIHNRSRLPRWHIHKIEDAVGDLNLDDYQVQVARLPRLSGGAARAEQLLEFIRLNINDFVDGRISKFAPYEASDQRLWMSPSPLGSVIHIDMQILKGLINIVDGSVVCSQHQSDNWIFSTVWTLGDQAHPVSGNRQFGFRRRDDSGYTFFTRAADRITRTIDLTASGAVFGGADQLWRSFQRKLSAFVNRHGGSSVVGPLSSRRYSWPAMRHRYHRPTTPWLY